MSREIRLVGAIAVRPVILALIPEFEAATGHTVAARWELNPIVKQQIEAGEPFDLVIINPNLVEALAVLGKLDPASQVPFGRIAMGVAAKAGRPLPDLGTVAAFEHALKSAASIAYANEGTSGSYFIGLLERLGIAGEVKPKLVATSGGQTAAAVAHGEAELAVIPSVPSSPLLPMSCWPAVFRPSCKATSTSPSASAPPPAMRKLPGCCPPSSPRPHRTRFSPPGASNATEPLHDPVC